MSVVVRTPEGKDRIISKGAPEAIFPRCANFELDGKLYPMDHAHIDELKKEYEQLSADGFRVLAIASKDIEPRGIVAGDATPYSKADECDLILNGYVAFLDPPKETAAAAIKALQGHGVAVKVITGDNDLVARKICKEVGLSTEFVLLGSEVEKMTDDAARRRGRGDHAVCPRLSRPQAAHHQGPAIPQAHGRLHGRRHQRRPRACTRRTSGISVDTAVDIAKESADMILLEKSLLVLEEGVVEGRKVFANILKYVRMGASSNFGNMFSVLGASVFVPFLPMAPIQILANNLLYDIEPDRHSDRRRRPRAGREAAPVGHQAADPLHRLHRPVLVDLRLHDVLHDALRLQLLERLDAGGRGAQREPVSDGLVRGEPAHADAHHPHHPHQQDPVPAEPLVRGR